MSVRSTAVKYADNQRRQRQCNLCREYRPNQRKRCRESGLLSLISGCSTPGWQNAKTRLLCPWPPPCPCREQVPPLCSSSSPPSSCSGTPHAVSAPGTAERAHCRTAQLGV
eukprot:1140003-Rhodomonas_salina.1